MDVWDVFLLSNAWSSDTILWQEMNLCVMFLAGIQTSSPGGVQARQRKTKKAEAEGNFVRAI